MNRTALLFTAASVLALSSQAHAATYVFGGSGTVADGQQIDTGGRTVQIRLDDGAIVSFVGDATFTVTSDGVSITKGGVTVIGATTGTGASTMLRFAEAGQAAVNGAATFTVGGGKVQGYVMNGTVAMAGAGGDSSFAKGSAFAATGGQRAGRIFANAAQPVPGAVFSQKQGGIAAAAFNGIPISLGEALAAAGASGDIVSAARRVSASAGNPAIRALPSGDVKALLAYSDALAAALGGVRYPNASPVLINSYLGYLSQGGRIADFQTAYLAIVSQYLELLAAGGVSGDFDVIDAASLNAYLNYIAQTGLVQQLARQQQDLVATYLAYLANGGAPGQFSVNPSGLSQELVNAYAALIAQYVQFLQGGGVPAQFAGATPEIIAQYLAALETAGVFDAILGAQADLLRQYLAFVRGGGSPGDFAGFDPTTPPPPPPPSNLTAAQQFAMLQDFSAHLAAGGLPSTFGEADLVTISSYFDALESRFDLRQPEADRALLRGLFRYVEGDKAADTYPALAANGGSVRTVRSAYAYANDAGKFVTTFGAAGAQPVLLNSDKLPFEGIPGSTTGIYPDAGATFADYAEAGGMTVARIVNTSGAYDQSPFSDTVNGGLHYAFAAPLANIPAGVTLAYGLAAATRPTFADGASDPGTFSGDIVVNYTGSALRLATVGSVTMPGDATYNFTTPGGLDGVLDLAPAGFPTMSGGFMQPGNIALTGTGRSCLSGASCTLFMVALPGGDGADQLAVSYESRGGGVGSVAFLGAAGFSKTGNFTPGSGGGTTDPAPTQTPDATGPATQIANSARYDARTAYAGTRLSNDTIIRGILLAKEPLVLNDLGYAASVGALTTNSNHFKNISAKHFDGFGNADVVLGRYSDGNLTINSAEHSFSATQGYHYAISTGTANVVMPTEGYSVYRTLAKTKPTSQSGNLTPGSFDAQLAIGFGSQPKIAIEGNIQMPGDAVYRFSTIEGTGNRLKDVNQLGRNFSGPAGFAFTEALRGEGAVCPSGNVCELRFNGSLNGASGQTVVLAYQSGSLTASSTADPLSGAAAFVRNSAGVIVPPPPVPDPDPEPTTFGTDIIAYSASVIGIDLRTDVNINRNANGSIYAYQWSDQEKPNSGNTSLVEFGGVADVIGWTRWTDGRSGGTYYSLPGADIPANAGWHLVGGTPATNLPASGTVQYALVGNTSPTIRDGSLAPGTFAGALGVAFGSTPMVGLAFEVAIGGNSYSINTPGGAADPLNGGRPVDMDPASNQYLTFGAANGAVPVGGSGPVCSGSGTCEAVMRGFLAGEGASHVGVTYTFGNQSFGQQVDGVAAFAKAP